MALFIRDEAHHFLLECWAEHHQISNGCRPKLFEHPIPKEFFNSKGGETFAQLKPLAFKIIDQFVEEYIKSVASKHLPDILEMIQLADNRMIMGDYRYGSIIRQNLDLYNTNNEFNIRIKLAYNNHSLEYLIDAYNMVRIQFLKDDDYIQARARADYLVFIYPYYKRHEGWTLNSVDDGHHAEQIQ